MSAGLPKRPRRGSVQPTVASKARAIDLRRRMSMPERVLWNALKRERERGLVFRRQHPLGPFIADFYCHAAALVVEVDGAWSHGSDRRPDDPAREAWMRSRGVEVMRIAARQLPRELWVVAAAIRRRALERIDLFRHGAPSAARGARGTSPAGSGGG